MIITLNGSIVGEWSVAAVSLFYSFLRFRLFFCSRMESYTSLSYCSSTQCIYVVIDVLEHWRHCSTKHNQIKKHGKSVWTILPLPLPSSSSSCPMWIEQGNRKWVTCPGTTSSNEDKWSSLFDSICDAGALTLLFKPFFWEVCCIYFLCSQWW